MAATLAALLAGSGCATVRPWERGRLADPIMMFDEDPVSADARAHMLRAREGSAGATGGGGGGCGCEQ